jgi:sorting nexin-3/12
VKFQSAIDHSFILFTDRLLINHHIFLILMVPDTLGSRESLSAFGLSRCAKINLVNWYLQEDNVLDIIVKSPRILGEGKDRYVDYEIICRSSHPLLRNEHESRVRRRYSDFVKLRSMVIAAHPSARIPELPPRRFFSYNFDESTIAERVVAFQAFLQMYVKYALS